MLRFKQKSIKYHFLRIWYDSTWEWTQNKQNESYFLIPNNSRPALFRMLAEWYETKSHMKLGGFRPQLQASYMTSRTE